MQSVIYRKRSIKGGVRTTEKMFSVVIAFLPLLYQYRGIGSVLSFGEVLLIPFVLYFMSGMLRRKVKYNKFLLLFYVVTVVTTLLNSAFDYFQFADTLTLFLRLVFYGFVVWIARDHFDYGFVKKIYIFSVFAFSSYLIIQYIYHYTIDGFLPIYLKYELLFPPEMGIRGETLAQQFRYYYRASSVFLEPSYFSFYVMPAVCILLFQNKKNKFEIVTFVITCIAMLLSTASSGLIGLALLLGLYLFKRTKGQKSIVKIGLVLAIILLGLYYFVSVESSSVFLNMLTYGASFNYRVGRGWYIYMDLPIFHKIFGVGINNLEPYMHYYNISTAYDEGNLNYICTLLGTPVYSGIIGLIFLLFYLGALRKKAYNSTTAAYFWMIVFIMSYETILFTYKFAFLIIIYEALTRCTKEEENVLSKNGLEKYRSANLENNYANNG